MKIAFVANTSWNIYNFRKGLVHFFLSRGDVVIVYAPKDEYSQKIADWGVTLVDTPLQGTGTNPVKDAKYFSKLRREFKKQRPDVVLSYTIKANIYSCLASIGLTKVICNVSGLGTVFLTKNLSGQLAYNLYRVSFKHASHIFFQNEEDKNLFGSMISVNPKRISTLPGSGIDLIKFKVLSKQTGSKTRFLMISRVIVEKGVREYAKAASFFAGDDRVSFTLIGKYDSNHARSIDKSELDEWVKNKWLTYRPHSDSISEVIGEHDVIVLPSYREGTSRTLLEGAAHGRALLAADVPGCREVVDNGFNGFLFEPKNSDDLVRKIKLYLALNEEEKNALSINSRRLVENRFDEKKVVDAYDQVIHRIIHAT